MRTQSINSAEKNNTNIIAAGIGGAGVAALASRFMPLLESEKNAAFTQTVKDNIHNHVITARSNKFGSIADAIQDSTVSDVFVKSKAAIVNGTQDAIEAAANNLNETGKATYHNLVKEITDAGANVERVMRAQVTKDAKKSRPMAYFALFAALCAMTVALLKNVISAKAAQKNAVAINYDKDGMIIDAPDDMSLAIMLDTKA